GMIAGGVVLAGGIGFAVYWFLIRDKPGTVVATKGKEKAGEEIVLKEGVIKEGPVKEGRAPDGDPRKVGRMPPPPGWAPFNFPEPGFRVHFPAEPTVFGAEAPSKRYFSPGKQVSCTVRLEAVAPDKLDERLKEVIFQQPHFKAEPDQRPSLLSGRPAIEVV